MIVEYPNDLDRGSIVVAEYEGVQVTFEVCTSKHGYYLSLEDLPHKYFMEWFKFLGSETRDDFSEKVEEILGYCDNEDCIFPWIKTLKDLKKLIKEL